MLELLVDKIFVVFGERFSSRQQSNGHKLCPSPSRHISLFIRSRIHTVVALYWKKNQLESQFKFIYRYLDDVLSINNRDFDNYLGNMYPDELDIIDTAESNDPVSYSELLLCTLPFTTNVTIATSISPNIRSWVAKFHLPQSFCAVISQRIRYAMACSSYEWFILRAVRLSSKLLGQEYVTERLKTFPRKFFGYYEDLINHYDASLSQMLHDILGHDHIQWHPQLIT